MAVSGPNVFIVVVSIIAPIIYSGQVTFLIQKLNELCHWKLGCNPLPSVGNVTLYYFEQRGRAEPIRLLMEDNGIPYRENRYPDHTSWVSAKQSGIMTGLFTFGEVPVITTNRQRHLAQGVPILHYLGRSVGLDCDCADIGRCEMIASGVEELQMRKGEIEGAENFSLQRRNEYFTRVLPLWLRYFEKLISGESFNWYFQTKYDGPYFASGRLTWLDYLVFDIIESSCDLFELTQQQDTGTLDSDEVLDLPESCLQLMEKFPNLGIFMSNFHMKANIARYMSSGRRIPYKLPVLVS